MMKNRVLLTLFLFSAFGLLNVSGQIQTVEPSKPPVTKKTISGGVLNGKAITLVKPVYPAAARSANIGGAVNVQVTIDESGTVISAKAVSGAALLHEECERAAMASKFAPTILSGQPVMVTGIIIYNFIPAMTVTQVGYELSMAEKSKLIQKSQIDSISGSIPATWEKERELLKRLDSLLVEKTAPDTAPVKPEATNSDSDKTAPSLTFRGNTVGTVSKERIGSRNADEPVREGIATRIGSLSFDSKYLINDEGIAVINELQSNFKKRLGVRENILWAFNLGEISGKLKAEIENSEKTRTNVSAISQMLTNMPIDVPQALTEKMEELVRLSNQTMTNAERVEKMSPLIENLRNIKSY